MAERSNSPFGNDYLKSVTSKVMEIKIVKQNLYETSPISGCNTLALILNTE